MQQLSRGGVGRISRGKVGDKSRTGRKSVFPGELERAARDIVRKLIFSSFFQLEKFRHIREQGSNIVDYGALKVNDDDVDPLLSLLREVF